MKPCPNALLPGVVSSCHTRALPLPGPRALPCPKSSQQNADNKHDAHNHRKILIRSIHRKHLHGIFPRSATGALLSATPMQRPLCAASESLAKRQHAGSHAGRGTLSKDEAGLQKLTALRGENSDGLT